MSKQTTTIQKHTRPGKTPDGDLYVTIQYRDGRLSIVGVEGPKANGDATGGCGQTVDALSRIKAPAPGWEPEDIAKLREVWERWHLNDMQPGCEHQRATWDTRKILEVVAYKLTREAWALKHEAEKEALYSAKVGREPILDATQRALLGDGVLVGTSATGFKIVTPPNADSPLSGCYEVDKRENKAAGWVRPEEHPRGLLCKPCGVCGYKYGSAWLYEEVPADVLQWLEALPVADKPIPGPWARF